MNFWKRVSILVIFKSILYSCSDVENKNLNLSFKAVEAEYSYEDDIKSQLQLQVQDQDQVYPPSHSVKIFDHLPMDLWHFIGSFFKNPVTKLGSINKRLFGIFHNEFSLKYFINQNFNIPELNLGNFFADPVIDLSDVFPIVDVIEPPFPLEPDIDAPPYEPICSIVGDSLIFNKEN